MSRGYFLGLAEAFPSGDTSRGYFLKHTGNVSPSENTSTSSRNCSHDVSPTYYDLKLYFLTLFWNLKNQHFSLFYVFWKINIFNLSSDGDTSCGHFLDHAEVFTSGDMSCGYFLKHIGDISPSGNTSTSSRNRPYDVSPAYCDLKLHFLLGFHI